MAKVYIVIYTTYSHIYKMAKGPPRVWRRSHDLSGSWDLVRGTNVPVITAEQLAEADGFIFGFGTRFGQMPTQFKSYAKIILHCLQASVNRFLNSTGGLWTCRQIRRYLHFHRLSTWWAGNHHLHHLALSGSSWHHLCAPRLCQPQPFDISTVSGGSPYGAGCIAGGDGSRQLSESELAVAKTQGENFGKLIKTYAVVLPGYIYYCTRQHLQLNNLVY
ncbi:NAD(P)H:quinone oxidoreductase, type IV [Jimgerdemannia flammicorona]|uniref:NAD(P)H:quinone oxidoreductase, type IV n=1 Tax=Jimgerdemannia flammicorona TaxID=994334 RepID=A0A433QLF6_9FUNG|nr:NAD(P)H:quinone oxidoreductase, type IV [Jimgerdemannia flammicorona]